MIDAGRFEVAGVGIQAIDYEAAVAKLISAAETGTRCTASALAVHGVMTGVLDPEHRYRLNALDLVVPDGQPVRWALRWLHGVSLPDRVYGPNLTLFVLREAAARGIPVYFYGSTPATLQKLLENLGRTIPGLVVAGSSPSQFRQLSQLEVDEVCQTIKASGAKIVLVGLGCPRQEVFAFETGDSLGMPVIAVGAAFDFHAGTLRQAPARLQSSGLEWAYRLYQEPRRLWRRYAYLNPLYLASVVLQKTGLLGRLLGAPKVPVHQQRFG